MYCGLTRKKLQEGDLLQVKSGHGSVNLLALDGHFPG